jgi:hypothetical protein
MTFENGMIQTKMKTGGGFDSNDYPIESSESWSEPIPCHIKVNRKNNLGKQNGNAFTIASYEVFIELQPFESERVKLTEHGQDLGEFSVLWTECLDAVCALKIVV